MPDIEITDALLNKLEHLARLKIPEGEREGMKKDLTKILNWMKQLDEVDVDGVEPLLNISGEMERTRDDQIGEHLDRKKALDNASNSDGEFFRVTKVK